MPLQQLLSLEQAAGGIVRVDHDQHIEAVEQVVDVLALQLQHLMPGTPPALGMFGVTR
ncbi:hypothetical protein D3C72_2351990 [compost metagenome]